MAKNDVVYVMDNQRSRSSGLVISGGGGGSGGGSSVDTSAFLRRDGTTAMFGNLDMGGFSVTNVSLVDGIDIPAHVANPDAHHARAHAYNSAVDHTGLLDWDKIDFGNSELLDIRTRPHSALQGIGPNDHHNQVHNITGSDHTVIGTGFDLVGLPSNNVLGLLTPSFNPLATAKILRTDANGELFIKRLNGTDYVKSAAYLQAATYVQAGSYVSAVTYVDSPILQQAGNVSIISGINIALKPTGYVYIDTDKSIRTNSFVSGFAGGGWQIDQNISAPGTNAEFDNLTIRGRMRVYELIIQQIRATNGSIFVSSVAKAKTVTLVSGDTYTITSDDYHGFLLNDLIRAQRFTSAGVSGQIYRCDMRVTGVTDLYTFTAVRENASDIPKVGYDFVRIGNTSNATRRGALYLSSDDSNAPFIDVINGVDSWTAWTQTAKTKVRIGKITGITSQANEYGLIAGNTGFGDNDAWIKVSNLGIQMNNIPLKFFSYRNSVSSWTGYWSADGNELWLGRNVNDKYLVWNNDVNTGNASLTVKGSIFVTGGDAATQGYANTVSTNAKNDANNYTNSYAPNKALSNTSVGWAASNTIGGNANDVNFVNGAASSDVKNWANNARLGLNSSGQVILGLQGPNIPNDSAVTGLNMTRNYLGYFNGTYWTLFMKSDGTFRFGSTATNNRIEWNGTTLAGYNAASPTTAQWYASAADGLLYAGAGYVIIGNQGIVAGSYAYLNSAGLSVIRPSITYTYDVEPGSPLDTGTYPNAANSIDLQDTAFYASDIWGNYLNYAGQSTLRVYSSSKHYVSDDTAFGSDRWNHYIDGVVEVPPISKPSRVITTSNPAGLYPTDIYTTRLFLRNVYSSIVLYEFQKIEINANEVFFNYYSSTYQFPQLQTYLKMTISTTIGGSTAQLIASNNQLGIYAGQSGTQNLYLQGSNVTIGNATSYGTITTYGPLHARQWVRLMAQYNNGVYYEWYARLGNATRSAWMGFGDATTTQLSIINELGSVIYLSATDKVIISNKLQIGEQIHFVRQSGTPDAIPGIVQMYQGSDGNMYFRGPNGYVRITGLTVISGSFP